MSTIHDELFDKIDQMISRIQIFQIEPLLENEIKRLTSLSPHAQQNESDLLRTFSKLVAFSQAANSKFVRDQLVNTDHFNRIFLDFDVEKVARIELNVFLEENWVKPLTYVQKKGKIRRIIEFAKMLQSGRLAIFRKVQIPQRVYTFDDVTNFWNQFVLLQYELERISVPFIKTTTTLLHFLLETGYDCIKPDSAVMEVADRLEIGQELSGDIKLKETVRILMEYSISRTLRPSIVDLYFLIAKPQQGAKHYVREAYYQ